MAYKPFKNKRLWEARADARHQPKQKGHPSYVYAIFRQLPNLLSIKEKMWVEAVAQQFAARGELTFEEKAFINDLKGKIKDRQAVSDRNRAKQKSIAATKRAIIKTRQEQAERDRICRQKRHILRKAKPTPSNS